MDFDFDFPLALLRPYRVNGHKWSCLQGAGRIPRLCEVGDWTFAECFLCFTFPFPPVVDYCAMPSKRTSWVKGKPTEWSKDAPIFATIPVWRFKQFLLVQNGVTYHLYRRME